MLITSTRKNTFYLKVIKMKKIISVLLLAVIAFAFCSCDKITDKQLFADKQTQDTLPSNKPENEIIGEGAASFVFEVYDENSNVNIVTVKTNKKTVGEALIELGIIEGEQGPYGLYVKAVNGIYADYDTDGAYWAFYINGEYAVTGVDMTEIDETAVYSFRYETL